MSRQDPVPLIDTAVCFSNPAPLAAHDRVNKIQPMSIQDPVRVPRSCSGPQIDASVCFLSFPNANGEVDDEETDEEIAKRMEHARLWGVIKELANTEATYVLSLKVLAEILTIISECEEASADEQRQACSAANAIGIMQGLHATTADELTQCVKACAVVDENGDGKIDHTEWVHHLDINKDGIIDDTEDREHCDRERALLVSVLNDIISNIGVYTTYCGALKTLSACSKRLAEPLKQVRRESCRDIGGHVLSVSAVMLKPVQRLGAYSQYMNQLLKVIPASNPSYAALKDVQVLLNEAELNVDVKSQKIRQKSMRRRTLLAVDSSVVADRNMDESTKGTSAGGTSTGCTTTGRESMEGTSTDDSSVFGKAKALFCGHCFG